MDTNLDPSIRLAALQSAHVGVGVNTPALEIVARAYEFYAFLRGGFAAHGLASSACPDIGPENIASSPTIEPLPLDGHDLVPTAEAVETAKRKRRTKTEMEAARAAEDEAKDLEAAATRAKVRAEIAKLDAIEAAKEATAATPAPVAAAPEVADVKAALMKVVEKDGLGPTAGGKLLAQFGVKRVSELDAKTFADFISACFAAVAGPAVAA